MPQEQPECTVGQGGDGDRIFADTAGKTLTTSEINSTQRYFFVSLIQVSESQVRVSSWANLIYKPVSLLSRFEESMKPCFSPRLTQWWLS